MANLNSTSIRTYLEHELPHRVFSLLTRRVRRQHGGILPYYRGPCSRRWRRGLVGGVGRGARVRVHEEHEFDVAAGEEAVDVVVLESVDFFEISVN